MLLIRRTIWLPPTRRLPISVTSVEPHRQSPGREPNTTIVRETPVPQEAPDLPARRTSRFLRRHVDSGELSHRRCKRRSRRRGSGRSRPRHGSAVGQLRLLVGAHRSRAARRLALGPAIGTLPQLARPTGARAHQPSPKRARRSPGYTWHLRSPSTPRLPHVARRLRVRVTKVLCPDSVAGARLDRLVPGVLRTARRSVFRAGGGQRGCAGVGAIVALVREQRSAVTATGLEVVIIGYCRAATFPGRRLLSGRVLSRNSVRKRRRSIQHLAARSFVVLGAGQVHDLG